MREWSINLKVFTPDASQEHEGKFERRNLWEAEKLENKVEQWSLFYDGGCNLCHSTQLRLEKWAKKHSQPMKVDILQCDEAIQKGYSLEGMVLEVDGKPLKGYEAWLHSMKVAPWGLRWIHALRNISAFRFLARTGYQIVAKYRIKWFGSRACSIPSHKSVS
jgi:predicted DCC family thiol-disulfide oxidoreductase YuxK